MQYCIWKINIGFTSEVFLIKLQKYWLYIENNCNETPKNIGFTLEILSIKIQSISCQYCSNIGKCKHSYVLPIFHTNISNIGKEVTNKNIIAQ